MNPKAGRILCATNLSNKSVSTYRYALQKARENNAKDSGMPHNQSTIDQSGENAGVIS